MEFLNRTNLGEQFRSLTQFRDNNSPRRTDLSLVNSRPSRFVDARYIAVLGFAEACNWKNRTLAFHIGRRIAAAGYGVLCGNTTSTFDYAFRGAKEAGGLTQAIIDPSIFETSDYCDNEYLAATPKDKHRLILKHARGAIVIGGGRRTRELAVRLAYTRKPVIAIEGSGGVVTRELPKRIPRAGSAIEAMDLLLPSLRNRV